MFTYITTTTVPSFPAIQESFDPPLTVELVNWTVAIPALGLAIGPLIWSSLADIVGRRFIFILGTVTALSATIGAAKATSYGGYMAARLFQGLGVSPAATVGLAIINDLFFEHERGQKVGLWVLAIDSGLFVGPLVGGFIQAVDHYWVQWLTAILFGVILVAEVALMPETLYPRDFMLTTMANAGDETMDEKKGVAMEAALATELPAAAASVQRTKKLPFINVMPVPALKHPKPWDSIIRFGKLFKVAVVPLSVGVFCFSWYWWILDVITMLPVAYFEFSAQTQG